MRVSSGRVERSIGEGREEEREATPREYMMPPALCCAE